MLIACICYIYPADGCYAVFQAAKVSSAEKVLYMEPREYQGCVIILCGKCFVSTFPFVVYTEKLLKISTVALVLVVVFG